MSGFSISPGQAASVMGLSQAPSVTATALLGASGSASIEGTNTSGKITLVVNGLGIGIGKIMSMTFNDIPNYKTGCAITFTPGNAAFATVMGQLYAVTSKTGVDLYVAVVGLGAGTYIGYYQIIGY